MFKVQQISESRDQSGVLAAGFYRVAITSLELKPTKNNQGKCFHLAYNVVAPEAQMNAEVKDFILWEHPNASAQEGGHIKLADLLFTLQMEGFESIQELERNVKNKELVIEIISEESELNGRMYLNARVENYFSLGGKNRKEKKTLKPLVLGSNGKEPIKQRQKKVSAITSQSQTFDDVPF